MSLQYQYSSAADIHAHPGDGESHSTHRCTTLSDRFLRSFESALKFFRTWERVRESDASETFRDLLLRMEKLGFISNHNRWLILRDMRNRVAHEYLPGELLHLYEGITGTAVPEFRTLVAKASARLR